MEALWRLSTHWSLSIRDSLNTQFVLLLCVLYYLLLYNTKLVYELRIYMKRENTPLSRIIGLPSFISFTFFLFFLVVCRIQRAMNCLFKIHTKNSVRVCIKIYLCIKILVCLVCIVQTPVYVVVHVAVSLQFDCSRTTTQWPSLRLLLKQQQQQ